MAKRCCKTVNPFISFNNFNQGFNKIQPKQDEPPSCELLLDAFPGAEAAFALRQLDCDAVNCVEVRRASDNATQDIGFEATPDGTGNYIVDRTALETFCAGTNGFIRTWYDQSGNGNNITQTTNGNQPQIVENGNIITDNTLPTIRFDGSQDYLQGCRPANPTAVSSFIAYSTTDPTAEQVAFQYLPNFTNAADRGVSYGFAFGGANRLGVRVVNDALGVADDGDTFNSTAQSIVSNIGDVTTPASVTRIDGVAATQAYGARYQTNASAIDELVVGSWVAANNYFLGGKISELIIYNSNQTANVSDIESNLSTYYSQSTFEAEFIAVYDQFVEKPSDADAAAQNTFVKDGVDNGWLADLDRMFVLAGHSAALDADVLIDWVNPTGTSAAAVNAPGYVQKQGVTGNGLTSYINSNYNPVSDGINYIQNDASHGGYSRSNVAGDERDLGSFFAGDSRTISLNPRDGSDLSRHNINDDGATPTSDANTDSRGMFSGDRSASNVRYGFKNGVAGALNGVGSIGIPNFDIYICGLNLSGSPALYSTRQISLIWFGASLGATKQLQIYNAFQALMTHYGTQV